MCYWTQASDNGVDWTWYNHGEDPATYNGPDYDHTTGGASGRLPKRPLVRYRSTFATLDPGEINGCLAGSN